MESKITIFDNEKFGTMRTKEINQEIYFNLTDVCRALEIKNVGNAKTRLSEAGIRTMDVRCENENGIIQNRAMTFINEANLYKCIFQSRKKSAEEFTEWVTGEILPSIRKHGAYMTNETIDSVIANPDNMIKILTALKEEKEHRKVLEVKMEENRPKVLFADCVAGSRTSILVRDLAKILRQNGLDIGEKRLYARLRKDGYLTTTNQPTQKSMNLGLFEIKEGHYINAVGASVTTLTTKVTGKGQIYFVNKYKADVIEFMED